MQRHFTKPESKVKFKLLGQIFDCDVLGKTILINLPYIAEGFNDIVIIFLVLFVP